MNMTRRSFLAASAAASTPFFIRAADKTGAAPRAWRGRPPVRIAFTIGASSPRASNTATATPSPRTPSGNIYTLHTVHQDNQVITHLGDGKYTSEQRGKISTSQTRSYFEPKDEMRTL